MFLNHTKAFAEFDTADRPALTALCHGTLLETDTGWCPVEALRPGDLVQTLDGGLRPLQALHHAAPDAAARPWLVPAGALDNCSDLVLTDRQFVALSHPLCDTLFAASCVLAPIGALSGYRGIRPMPATRLATTGLRFAAEEIVYAQTGTLLHVGTPTGTAHFTRLSYGRTRALLTLIARGHVQPDPLRFAA